MAKDDPSSITSYEVYFSLYQQLVGDDEEERLRAVSAGLLRPRDRRSVPSRLRQEERRWRRILEYFSSATQIGMTATPRRRGTSPTSRTSATRCTPTASRRGIEDGFLAPFRVINITTDISDGWRPYKGAARHLRRRNRGQNLQQQRLRLQHRHREDRIRQVARRSRPTSKPGPHGEDHRVLRDGGRGDAGCATRWRS